MFGQDGELTHDHRQLAIVLHVEIEGDLVLPRRFGPRHVLVVEAHARIGGLVHLEAVDDVLGRDRLAVMPACLVAELEGDRGVVGRIGGPFGDQAVGGGRLVQTVGHQVLIDEAEPARRLALVEHRIEAIEAADIGHAHDAAFRRVGIDEVEMGEARGIFRLADQRQRMAVDGRILGPSSAGKEAEQHQGEGEARQSHDRQLGLHLIGK